jgi:hypothetical protein
VLGAALPSILALTVHTAVRGGIDILTVLSVLVLGVFTAAVGCALLHPPDR